MKLRGLTRVVAATATALLLVGAFSAPAQAEPQVISLDLDDEGALFAKDYKTKGCAGIADGKAKAGTDGWLFSKLAGEFLDYQYVMYFVTGEGEDDIALLLVDADGVHSVKGIGELDAKALKQGSKATLRKAVPNAKSAAGAKAVIPTEPAPAGVEGALSDDGGWLRTPAGWLLMYGTLIINLSQVEPEAKAETEVTFALLRVCLPPVTSATPSASVAPSASGGAGGGLPVTGTNVWLLTGTGAALLVAGATLLLVRRRRDSVKFVA